MPPALLDSQFATLEAPDADERAIEISAQASVEQAVAEIGSALEARGVMTS